jgi:ankyrin repeat protein
MRCPTLRSVSIQIAMLCYLAGGCGGLPAVRAAAQAGVAMPSGPAHQNGVVTRLLAAVGAGDVALVHRLLQSGANPNDPAAGRSPLIQAITSFNPRASVALTCNHRIVQLLLSYGADPNRPDPRTGALPLLTAFDVGDVACARMIRNAGGRADARDAGGRSLLTAAVGAAARHRDTSILNVAIDWGADPNERSNDGTTALHEAVRVDSAEVAQALLDRGADPCARNDLGQTPLEMAVSLKRSEALVRALRLVTHCGHSS